MSVEQVAADHYRAQQTIARQTVEQAQTLWSEVEPAAVVDSWLGQLAAMLRTLVLGQAAAAALSQPYVEALAVQQGIPPAGGVNPAAFAGVAADGRALTSLLMQPALRTLGLLATGADDQTALLSGLASLTRIVDTEISDASRAADQVGLVANPRWVTYVRHVTLPACGRCIVLAGREYSWSTGFLRHERCDCSMIMRRAGEDPPPTPEQLFAQMTPEEQAKAFTVGGAEAIRLGADVGQVVNARRGMQTVGGKLVTTEGTTVRGIAGRKLGNLRKQAGSRYRRSQTVRPMPEQLISDANGNRDLAVQYLERFGYLLPDSRRDKARAEVESKAKAEAEKVRREAEAVRKAEVEAAEIARLDAAAKAATAERLRREAQARAEAAEKARQEAEAHARAEAEARAAAAAEKKAEAERVAREKAEAKEKADAEAAAKQARQEAEKKAATERAAQDKAEARARTEAKAKEKAALRPKPKTAEKPAPKADPVRPLAERIALGERSRTKLSGGMYGDTSLVVLNDGSKVVHKISKRTHLADDAVDQVDAEILGGKVARALGVRAANVHRVGPTEMYQEFMEGKLADSAKKPTGYWKTDDGYRMAFLDVLIDYPDRHTGNWILNGKQLVSIDHGLAFRYRDRVLRRVRDGRPILHRAGKFETLFMAPAEQAGSGIGEWIDNDMSPGDIAEARRRLTALQAEFAALGRDDWHAAMMARLDAIEPHAQGSTRRIPDEIPADADVPADPSEAAQRFHQNLRDLGDFVAVVENGFPPRTRRPLTGGESAETELITLKDGTKVVRKTSTAQEAAAEQAASMVARALGIRAPRVYRDQENAIYMEYVDDALTADDLRENHGREWDARRRAATDHDDADLIGLLDILTANSDRNMGNWMLTQNGRTIPIDHGHAFADIPAGGSAPRSLVIDGPFAANYDGSNPLTQADIAEIRRRLQRLAPDFEHIGRSTWLKYSLGVLDLLAPEASGFGNLIAEAP